MIQVRDFKLAAAALATPAREPAIAFTIPWQIRPPRPSRTIVVKATCDLVAGGPARLRASADAPSGDVHLDGDPRAGLLYPSDFALWKPRADVVLAGHARAPEGRTAGADVTFRFGHAPSGFARTLRVAGAIGAIPASSPARARGLGTHDEAWKSTRWPFFPADFDWLSQQAAPPAQQLDAVRGDEPFAITGMLAGRALRGRLPGVRARAFVDDPSAGSRAFFEAPMRLDTVVFDVDAGKLHLVWRGFFEASDVRASDEAAVFAMLEDLSATPRTASEARVECHLCSTARTPAALIAPAANDGSGICLRGARLAGADLRGAALARADLTGADLTGANLEGAVLAGAVLTGARLDDTRAEGADFSGATGRGASFTHASLAGARFGRATLPAADFSGAALDGAIFDHARLDGARLLDARGDRVSFQAARLDGARADGARFEGASLRGASAAGSVWDRATLRGSVLFAAHLRRASFAGASCQGAVFSRADVAEVDFSRARLEGASLLRAQAMFAVFEGADLSRVDLRGACLHGAELRGARLGGARLDLAITSMTSLERSA